MSIHDLGITSLTVFSNDEKSKSSLTKALSGLLAATALAGTISNSVQGSELPTSVGTGQDNYLGQMLDETVCPDSLDGGHLVTKGNIQPILVTGVRDNSEDIIDTMGRQANPLSLGATALHIAVDPTGGIMRYGADTFSGNLSANNLHHSSFAASSLAGAATAAGLGPIGMGAYVISQGYDTYKHIQTSKLRAEARFNLALEEHEKHHETLVNEMSLEIYKDERASWSTMTESEQKHKQALYVDAAVEYMQDPLKSKWIKHHLDMERVLAGSDGPLPWFTEANAKIAQIAASNEVKLAETSEAPAISAMDSFQAFNAATSVHNTKENNSFAAFNTATAGYGKAVDHIQRMN